MEVSPTANKPRVINGVTYIAAPLPASQALRLLVRMTKMVGEAALVIAARGRSALANLPPETLTYTVQTILARMTEQDVEQTVKELLGAVYVQGASESVVKGFDAHFRGSMVTLFKVIQYALETNYRDFFDEIRSLPIEQIPTGSEESAA